MSTVGLTVLYCLNLALTNGGNKLFELHNPTSPNEFKEMATYYTPAHCTSENEFWIKRGNAASHSERSKSDVDIRHRQFVYHAAIEEKEWYVMYFRTEVAVSITINGISVPFNDPFGLDEGDKIQFRYSAMSEPLNLVYGKCSEMNKTEPAKSATITTSALTSEAPVNDLTTLQLNLAESTSFDPLNKNMMREQRDIENLEELVKVLNEEMETLKLKIAQPDQGIGNTSGLSGLTVFTVLSVLAISIVLAFNIYQGKMQNRRIRRFSLDVNRHESKI